MWGGQQRGSGRPAGWGVSPETPVTSEFGFADRKRAILHDDTIYYVLEENAWSAFWLSPTMVNGPF